MQRKRMLTHEFKCRHIYKSCPVCQKMRPEECGLTAGDGQRWYCSERCLKQGERAHGKGA